MTAIGKSPALITEKGNMLEPSLIAIPTCRTAQELDLVQGKAAKVN